MAPRSGSIAAILKQNTDLIVGGLVISIVLLIIIPLPPGALDILLIISIILALSILLITMFTTEPLQFAIFPALLLVTTLYRLALNISSTRLILGNAEAGMVIEAFGQFVIGGQFIVGLIVFIIITVVQFVVITAGAGRVAEVAARFTLDAMPGKQMAIDADFNSGLITEEEARERRRRLQRESDFFGAMDGASKFVRGDAIAGIVIILINIIGGIAIGTLQMGMPVVEAMRIYTILTVGDGLVTQIPAVLISTAAGILVTRASTDNSFGVDIARQFSGYPKVLFLVAGIMFIMALIPAMPGGMLFIFALGLALVGYSLTKGRQRAAREEQEAAARDQLQEQKREPENVSSYFQVDPLQIEIGYSLIPLTDEGAGGELLGRLASVRRQCAGELGIYVRPIRIRDNLQLQPNKYVIKLRGEEIATGELMPGHYLAMDPAGLAGEVPGAPTTEPTFGLPAWWVSAADRSRVEAAGLTVVDCSTVLVTHLTEVIKSYAHELLGRQEVKELLDVVKERDAAVVDELLPDLVTVGDIQQVLQNLLKERVPIRDLATILEAIANAVRFNKDHDYLTEHVRSAIARTICRQYTGQDNKLIVLTLHPKLEHTIIEALQQTQLGTYPVLEPSVTRQILDKLSAGVEKVTLRGMTPVLLCSPRVRLPFKRLTERYLNNLAVLSLNEIIPGVEVEAVGTVVLE
ncbi:MAG: flagellar biosynthesis protein FlhA [Bacillota bacterium]|jgi:flagellar biosynthesis protein FlhA